MSNPKVKNLNHLFESGDSFSITEDEYKNLTGAYLPKSGNYYICHRSAIAKYAESFGYKITTNVKVLTFIKK